MAKHPCYLITQRNDGDFQFVLTAKNGQTILTSQGYAQKSGCKNGIESVRKNCPDDGNYQRKVSSNDKHFFNLLAANQQVIGTSQMYSSKAAMENGIESVKTNGPDAPVVDES